MIGRLSTILRSNRDYFACCLFAVFFVVALVIDRELFLLLVAIGLLMWIGDAL